MNVAVLLAAGGSTRFPGNKLLYRTAGDTLLSHTVRRLLAATGVDRCVAVVRPGAADVVSVLAGLGVPRVECTTADSGISASIATGMAGLPAGATRVLVALADQPVPTTVIDLVLRADPGRKLAVVPLYRGQRGNPVLFASEMFPALGGLSGDVGARNLLADMKGEVWEIETGLDMPPDLDCEEDATLVTKYLEATDG